MENNKPRTIEFNELGKFEKAGIELGKLVDSKQEAYGDSVQLQWEVTKVLLKQYETGENNDKYLIPKSLMRHLLLITRIGDKINRIVSNPSGDRMSESPYNDIGGYGLLGNNMVKSHTHEIIKNHDKYIKEMNDIYKEDDNDELKITDVQLDDIVDEISNNENTDYMNLCCYVNGKKYIMNNVCEDFKLETIVQLALSKAGFNITEKLSNWCVKRNGYEIDTRFKISECKIRNMDKLFITSHSDPIRLIESEPESLKLTFVVNGQTIVIHNADINSLFSTIVLNVLQLSIYKSIRISKIDKWVAKINDVNIEFDKSIKLNKLENNDKIFIILKSGIGG